MTTVAEIKNHFNQSGTQEISNEVAGYQFVKRADGIMIQFDMKTGSYKKYSTVDGLAKAALYRIKRG